MTMFARPTTRLACFAGTRPECLKVAPLCRAAPAHPDLVLHLVNSGQHAQMVDATLQHLGLAATAALPPVVPGTMLSRCVAHLRRQTRLWLQAHDVDMVLVQGDTSTAYACALGAADCGLPIAHLEAGLRTSTPMRPFPEEPFRRRIAPLARWHFAPTAAAAANLVAEGIAAERVHMVGNSVVDLLRDTLQQPCEPSVPLPRGALVLMTLHRRENYQHGLLQVCSAMLELLARQPHLQLLCPVHPNPAVGTRIRRLLGGHPRILLTPPLPYREFVAVMRHAGLIVTDSGGIQEEAPYLGVPVLVTRSETERPEAMRSGVRLIGTHPQRLVQASEELLAAPRPPACGFDAGAPFGDGRTAQRVLDILRASHQATIAA